MEIVGFESALFNQFQLQDCPGPSFYIEDLLFLDQTLAQFLRHLVLCLKVSTPDNLNSLSVDDLLKGINRLIRDSKIKDQILQRAEAIQDEICQYFEEDAWDSPEFVYNGVKFINCFEVLSQKSMEYLGLDLNAKNDQTRLYLGSVLASVCMYLIDGNETQARLITDRYVALCGKRNLLK